MFSENYQAIQGYAGIKLPFDNLGGLITNLLPYLFGLAGIVLLFMIVSAGFQMMTSVGNPKAMEAAQARLTTSLLGIVIIFVSFWLVSIVFEFFGLKLEIFN